MDSTTESMIAETTAPVETIAEEAEAFQVVEIFVDRPFLVTSFEEYTVSEGFLLLIFVLLLLNFFLNLFRR